MWPEIRTLLWEKSQTIRKMKHGSKKQGAYCPFHPKHSTPNWCLLLIKKTLHGTGLQVRLPEMCLQHTVKDSFCFLRQDLAI